MRGPIKSSFMYSSGFIQETPKQAKEEAKIDPAPVEERPNPVKAGKKAFRKFANKLSKFALENGVKIRNESKQIILSRLKQLGRGEKIPLEVLQLAHILAEHRTKPKFYKLDSCKLDHCGECIRDFFFNKDICEHGKNTFEKEKSDIAVLITKLNETYKICPVCNEGKDDIEFSLVRSEGCNVCDSCTTQNCINNVKDFYNLKCPRIGCENIYSGEIREILKYALATLPNKIEVPPPPGKNIICVFCNSVDKIREICEKECLCCENCAQNMKNNNVEVCPVCGSRASP
ncbi:unnamed protein product [Blepharisma stoltei]|uniref:RING-type domain-containing protein n=1 Tax=Blepharisma stoltei TaxID=1481888 RepID=A0AAU9ID81_9CILI|nr:unnamed protein product [Blepharisma stoltei]